MRLTRRRLLGAVAATGGVAVAGTPALALRHLQAIVGVDNPLESYPDRGWERVYRDQYRYDSSFTFVCSPNDTHACRLRCSVRNGVVTRIEQNYDVQRYSDPFGNTTTALWNPRGCEKGLTAHRRMYGTGRLKYPLMRKGWRRWADDGFPPLDAAARSRYGFDARGDDELARVSWDEATRYLARAFVAIARTYSGESGRRAAARGWLHARDDRRDAGRGDAHLQAPRGHGPPRRHRQVRHVPNVQLARAPRRPRAGRRRYRRAGRAQLVQLHLARRPGAGIPVRARPAWWHQHHRRTRLL